MNKENLTIEEKIESFFRCCSQPAADGISFYILENIYDILSQDNNLTFADAKEILIELIKATEEKHLNKFKAEKELLSDKEEM